MVETGKEFLGYKKQCETERYNRIRMREIFTILSACTWGCDYKKYEEDFLKKPIG
jgi:hypothetical protein